MFDLSHIRCYKLYFQCGLRAGERYIGQKAKNYPHGTLNKFLKAHSNIHEASNGSPLHMVTTKAKGSRSYISAKDDIELSWARFAWLNNTPCIQQLRE